jgi:hypothetical protein
MKSILISTLILISANAISQKLNIESIELVKEKMVIYYKLEDANASQQYNVLVYSSKDNYATPLARITGDAGTEVKPGSNKKIEWNMVQELGNYRGEIAIEVRARVYAPFVKITSFDAGKVYKRGKGYPLLWTSGNMGGQLDLELFNGTERVYGERNVPNTGKYEWFIPGSVKPGKDYHLKFTNTRNRDEFVQSSPFRIVPRIPFMIKAGGALLLIGGGAAIISGLGGSDPGGGTTTQENPLEGNPGTPTQKN